VEQQSVQVITDNSAAREHLVEVLRAAGFRVVASGEEAGAIVLDGQLAEARADLEDKTRELEAFSYSVSHDLRAPLRAISGFCSVLQQDHAEKLDDKGKHYLNRVIAGSQRMSRLIDDLLLLSRLTRFPLERVPIDLSQACANVVEELRARDPERSVVVEIQPGLQVKADGRLIPVLLQHLIGTAWKFTSRRPEAHIRIAESEPGTFFIQDNGAGFDSAFSDRLFTPFQRLHTEAEFEGTGVGLAAAHRIVSRHRGHITSQSAPDQGATFTFTLGIS
jgi:light-regulated signal transduction histidine kinase (bacteriophytochrome)